VFSVATRILLGRVVTLTGGFNGSAEAWRGRGSARKACRKEALLMSGSGEASGTAQSAFAQRRNGRRNGPGKWNATLVNALLDHSSYYELVVPLVGIKIGS